MWPRKGFGVENIVSIDHHTRLVDPIEIEGYGDAARHQKADAHEKSGACATEILNQIVEANDSVNAARSPHPKTPSLQN